MKLTVGMLKGGSARTTSAVYLALAEYARTGKSVLLVDLDPGNGTAFEWCQDAGESWPSKVEVAYWPVTGLQRQVEKMAQQGRADSIVIDTGNDSATLKAALAITDYLVIPLAPSGTESTRLTPTLEAAADIANKKHIELAILMNRIIPRTKSRREARLALEEMRLTPGRETVLTTEVPRLERIANAYGTVPELDPYDMVLEEISRLGKE